MQNVVALVGRLTKDVDVKSVGDNNVCNFTLAVNRPVKDGEADFIQCQAWNKQADFIGAYLSKGSLVAITGSLRTRTYDNDAGQTIYITEVNVNSVQSLESKKMTVEEIKALWESEWKAKSAGLDTGAKAKLKKELEAKYNPRIDALKPQDSPF